MTEASVSLFLLPGGVLACIVGVMAFGIVGLVGSVALRLPVRRAPQPPFHVAITSMFALMLSFAGGDAWKRSDVAYAALLREVAETQGLLQISKALTPVAPDAAAAGLLRDEVRTYLDVTLREEWAHRNTVASDAAEAVLGDMRGLTLTRLAEGGNPAWRIAYDRQEGLYQARMTRLVSGGLYGDMLRWGGLVALFTAGAVGICLVHLDRRPAGWAALLLYAAAGTIAMSMVAMVEHPYAGWDGTQPDRLVTIRAGL